MKRVKKPVDKDNYFDEAFKRLKTACGVQSDAQLARKLGITQQAVAYAKKKKKIPNSWIVRALKSEAGADFSEVGPDLLLTEVLLRLPKENVVDQPWGRGARIIDEQNYSKELSDMGKEQSDDLKKAVVQQLMLLASAKSGIRLNEFKTQILSVFILKHIFPGNLAKIIEIMREIEAIKMPQSK